MEKSISSSSSRSLISTLLGQVGSPCMILMRIGGQTHQNFKFSLLQFSSPFESIAVGITFINNSFVHGMSCGRIRTPTHPHDQALRTDILWTSPQLGSQARTSISNILRNSIELGCFSQYLKRFMGYLINSDNRMRISQ